MIPSLLGLHVKTARFSSNRTAFWGLHPAVPLFRDGADDPNIPILLALLPYLHSTVEKSRSLVSRSASDISALPLSPLLKRQDAVNNALGTVVNDAGLGSLYSEVETVTGSLKRLEPLTEVESLVNGTGLESIVSEVQGAVKRNDPAPSLESLVTEVESSVTGAGPVKRQDPASTIEGIISTIEDAFGGSVRRQDPTAAIEGIINTVDGALALAGAAKRQNIAAVDDDVGQTLTDLGLGSVVHVVDDVTKRDTDPLTSIESQVIGLAQIAGRDTDPLAEIENAVSEVTQIVARD
ncbi:hypothetical protein HWV62_6553 [Athelia sp. TMB]|nr:hypothetical protein HWV62_6553 [Athelia sp. TMB]